MTEATSGARDGPDAETASPTRPVLAGAIPDVPPTGLELPIFI
jgi:hypothetical protein